MTLQNIYYMMWRRKSTEEKACNYFSLGQENCLSLLYRLLSGIYWCYSVSKMEKQSLKALLVEVLINDLILFAPIWSYLDLLGPIWIYLDLFGPIWTYLDLFGPICTCLDLFGPILWYLDLFGPIWFLLVKFGSNLTKFDLIWLFKFLFIQIDPT